jgi:hypothetical protein
MAKNCFLCGKKFGFGENQLKLKDFQGHPIDLTPENFGEKDRLCITCYEFQGLEHYEEVVNYDKANLSPQDFDQLYSTSQLHIQMLEKYNLNQPLEDTPSPISNPVGNAMPTNSTGTPISSSPPQPPNIPSSKSTSSIPSTSATQLRSLTQTLHNQYKAEWDKNGVVQFKNNEIAILKRVWGQQVQFIVAYSQLTKEGYRLMAIDEGMEAQGSGFSGGASAYFYFQKMNFVR